MKKLLFGVLFIAMVASMIGAGTWAYFSDYEITTDNCFTAGTLDLKVNDQNDETLDISFDETCLAPCDSGQLTVTLTNDGCVPGKLDFMLFNLVDNENGCNEPEEEGCAGAVGCDPDPTCGTPGEEEGELSQYMWMEVWVDCDGGSVYDTEVISGYVIDLEDQNRYFCDCIADEDSVGLLITWEIDCEVGNIIQSDSLCFDIEFSLEQQPCMCDCLLEVTGLDQPDTVVEGTPYDFDVIAGCTCPGDPPCSGTCAGTVEADVKDDGGAVVWSGSGYIEGLAHGATGPVAMSMPTTGMAAGSYTVVAGAEVCPFEIVEPPEILVTAIDQPTSRQVCENLIITVYVTNNGDVTGSDVVLGAVADPNDPETYWTTFGPVPTGDVAKDQTVPIEINIGHVLEAWKGSMGMVAVGAQTSGQLEPFVCLPPIFVLNPPCNNVISIQQPDIVQPLEDIAISVDVENSGDKPGDCTIDVTLEHDTLGVIASYTDVPTGSVDPSTPVKVYIDTIPAPEPGLITVTAQACGGEIVQCFIDVLAGSSIQVTGIQQPEEAYHCDNLVVGIDVHQAGAKPGDCQVEVVLKDDATGAELGPPIIEPVPVLQPCETDKISVDLGHVDPAWPPVVRVEATACGDSQPFVCPIIVSEPPPPIPEPCCYCIYEATYYECGSVAHPEPCDEMPEPGVTEFDAQEYYVRHTEIQHEAGYEIPGCVPPTTVAAPCYEYHTTFYDMTWAPAMPYRYAGALGFMVWLADMGGWMDKEDLSSFVSLFQVDITEGGGAYMYVWAINQLDGWVIAGDNAGWPYALGNEWVTHTQALGGGVDTWTYSIVSDTTTLPKPADVANPVYPSGTLECYQVDAYTWADANTDGIVDPGELLPSGISYYHNDYGCQILEIVFPGLILQGWEWRWLQWYCHAPDWPADPPPLPWWSTP